LAEGIIDAVAILMMQITPPREDQDHHRSSVVFLEEMDKGGPSD